MKTTRWCYTRDGRMTFGPVSWEELRRMASKGELLPSDLVGHVGMARPLEAGDVAGLFDLPGVLEGSDFSETISTGVHVASVPVRGVND